MILTLDPALLQAHVRIVEDQLRATPEDTVLWKEYVALVDVLLRLSNTIVPETGGTPMVLG